MKLLIKKDKTHEINLLKQRQKVTIKLIQITKSTYKKDIKKWN